MKQQSKISNVLLALFLLSLTACGPSAGETTPEAGPTSYPFELHDEIFSDRVTEAGRVDYKALSTDPRFAELLRTVHTANVQSMSEEQRFVFWINAYNILVIEGVLRHYPVESVLKIRFLHGFFKREPFQAGGRDLTLDDIEHQILRKQFEEPRIHFALVCAAASCPPLRREAYRPERINDQLDDQGRRFFRDPALNRLDQESRTFYMSSILKWFKEDFTHDGTTLALVAANWTSKPESDWLESNPDVRIQFLEYDWSLNDKAETKD